MIMLDYQTDNPRWKRSGMMFASWSGFSLTLGFLSNLSHFRDHGNAGSIWDDSVSIHIEGNQAQGAWEREGRIHYYKQRADLKSSLADLEAHSSAGNASTTCRINSNGYVLSLVHDFHFAVRSYTGYTTADVFPPEHARQAVKDTLLDALKAKGLPDRDIQECLLQFDQGFNM